MTGIAGRHDGDTLSEVDHQYRAKRERATESKTKQCLSLETITRKRNQLKLVPKILRKSGQRGRKKGHPQEAASRNTVGRLGHPRHMIEC